MEDSPGHLCLILKLLWSWQRLAVDLTEVKCLVSWVASFSFLFNMMCMVIIYQLKEAVIREIWDNIGHTLYIVSWSIFTTHVSQVSLAKGRIVGVNVKEGEQWERRLELSFLSASWNISNLLLHNKLPQNLAAQNNKHLLSQCL